MEDGKMVSTRQIQENLRNRKFRYEIKTVNQGPFKMYEVIDNNYNPPRKLLTTEDQSEAHKYVQYCLH